MSYKRLSDGNLFSSGSVTLSMDNATTPAVIVSPTANSTVGAKFVFKDSLPDVISLVPNNKKLRFAKGTDTTLLIMSSSRKDSFDFNVNNITSSSPAIVSASLNTLSEGLYDMLLEYKDAAGHDSAITVTKNITVDLHADPVTILSPLPNKTVPKKFNINYSLPEDAKSNTLKLVFNRGAAHDSIILAETAAGSHTLIVDAATISNTTSFVSSSLTSVLEDTSYTITMGYTDKAGNISSLSSVSGIKIDKHASTPAFTVPAVVSFNFNFQYLLPEKAAANSVKLVFEKGGSSDTAILSGIDSGSHSITIKATDIAGSTGIASSTFSALAEGTYALKLLYTDEYSNTSPVSASATVTVDLTTLKPIITSPADGTTLGKNFGINYTLPEKPFAGSVILTVSNNGHDSTIRLNANSSGNHILPMSNNIDSMITADTSIMASSVSKLADGTFSLRIIYLDEVGNPASSSDAVTIVIDTHADAPTILTPASNAEVKSAFEVKYSVPEDVATNALKLILVKDGETDTLVFPGSTAGQHTISIKGNNIMKTSTLVNSTTGVLPDGQYSLTVSYTDKVGNSASSAVNFKMSNDNITQIPLLMRPGNFSADKDTVHIAFSLPEDALANSVQLQLSGETNINIQVNAAASGSYTYTLPGNKLSLGTGVTSASADSLPKGTYTATLSYQDAKANPAASATNINYSYSYSDTIPVVVPDIIPVTPLPSLEFDISELKGSLNNGKPIVYWKTIAEKNTSYYEVQKSSDSVTFSFMGQVTAADSSTSDKEYSFIDQNASTGSNYYRLRMVDVSNVSIYTPVVSVYRDKTISTLKVFPIPATTTINMTMMSPVANQSKTVTLWNGRGQIVKRMKFNTVQGYNLFSIPLTGLAAGTYILQDGDKVTSFIKL